MHFIQDQARLILLAQKKAVVRLNPREPLLLVLIRDPYEVVQDILYISQLVDDFFERGPREVILLLLCQFVVPHIIEMEFLGVVLGRARMMAFAPRVDYEELFEQRDVILTYLAHQLGFGIIADCQLNVLL